MRLDAYADLENHMTRETGVDEFCEMGTSLVPGEQVLFLLIDFLESLLQYLMGEFFKVCYA